MRSMPGGQSTALSGASGRTRFRQRRTALGTGTITAGSVQLTWTDNASNRTGVCDRTFDEVSADPPLSEDSRSRCVTTDAAGLSPSTTYYYQIYAYNAGGTSSTR
ncbi:MAG: fibronectin type III domain-containing protein [Bacteroidales bacterium]